MSNQSYADAAASSGPIGAEKIPEPARLQETPNPSGSGNIESVSQKKFDKLKQETEKSRAHLEADVERAKKEAKELEKKAKKEGKKLLELLKQGYADAGKYFAEFSQNVSETTNAALTKTLKELENPVVVIQALAGIGGLVAGYVTYLERHRIRSDSNTVLGIHAAIITGLIGLDAYLFGKYYPKYDKKQF